MERETAEQVKKALMKYFEAEYGDAPDFGLHDHNHEELEEGSWSLNAEGWYDNDGNLWAYCLPTEDELQPFGMPEGVWLEPLYGWLLGVYDKS